MVCYSVDQSKEREDVNLFNHQAGRREGGSRDFVSLAHSPVGLQALIFAGFFFSFETNTL